MLIFDGGRVDRLSGRIKYGALNEREEAKEGGSEGGAREEGL